MSEHPAYELIKQQFISEINTLANWYRHKKTGAQLLSLINDDENKVFGVTFRTPPQNPTGVAHILEHSVLCGSRKYPIKEPFVELIKGSLKTFLNAFTFPDKTCYPVASQNKQDFYNLIDVYLDAVFFPLITEYTFLQEGWHIAFEDHTPSIKGVVYNEMKGAYSSPDQLLARHSFQSLFPDTLYRYDSGGDPEVIPSLTYADFLNFHKTYYHPSNARFFFYGDDDPIQRLEIIHTVIDAFDKKEINSTIHPQPYLSFSEPKRLIIPYPINPQDKNQNNKWLFTMNWLLSGGENQELTLSMQILNHILLGTPASPLRKTLIESGLGEDITGGGLDSDLIQLTFSCGLKGYNQKDQYKIETLIMDTLAELSEQGIDKDTIEASLNTIEFALRENNTGYFPRGLSLMLRSLTNWLYDYDPVTPIAFEKPLTAIKEKVSQNDRYFERLIEQFFLSNNHRTIVILEPDETLEEKLKEKENVLLHAILSKMDDNERQLIIQKSKSLLEYQNRSDSPEDLAKIPTLKLSDIDRVIKIIPKIVYKGCENIPPHVEILHHPLFTNQIIYLDLAFDLRRLPQELLPYCPIFARSLTEFGTKSADYIKLIQQIGKHTGGIYTTLLFSPLLGEPQQCISKLIIRSKSTPEKFKELLKILKDILLNVNLDNRERFRQIALETKASLEASIKISGHQWLKSRLSAKWSLAANITEQISGFDYLTFIRQLIPKIDTQWDEILNSLEQIRESIINSYDLVGNVTIDEDNWKNIFPSLLELISSLPVNNQISHPIWKQVQYPDHEGFVIPIQINFVGKGMSLFSHLGYEKGSISVVINHLRTDYLWDKIRVQGGAYGSFCAYDRLTGSLIFLSYRDPQLENTLEAFDKIPEYLRNLTLEKDELTKIIIGVIGELDAYQLPDAKGYSSFIRHLIGITDEERQLRRDEIFNACYEDFLRFAEMIHQFPEQGKVAILSSAEKINSIKHKINIQEVVI